MFELARDLRIAVRSILRTPALAAAAVLSLALGIGLSTIIFSITNAVLLRDLPVGDPGELVRIGQTVRGNGFTVVSHAEYREVATLDAFDGVAAHHPNGALLNLGDGPFEVAMELVSGNYFDVLRVAMARGRGFIAAEDRAPGTHPVAVLSFRLWQERLAGDRQVVGRVVRVNGHPFEVVGVAPEGFSGAFPGFLADLWVPVMMQAEALPRAGNLASRSDRFLNLIARLRPRTSIAVATAQLDAAAARLAAEHPQSNGERGLAVASARGVHPNLAGVAGPFLGFLMAVVGLVLLIATANVTNLILARATNRRREAAVRLALGAGRGRLVRDHTIEALVLTVPGALLGVLVALWGRSLVTLVRPPAGLPAGLGIEVPIDLRVLGFALGVAALLGALLGVVPALASWRARSLSPATALHAGHSGGRRRLRGALVAAQVAVSCVLLVGTGLLLQTIAHSSALDAGFAADDVLIVSADPTALGYDAERVATLWETMRERAASLPRVEAVAFGLFVPLGSRADQVSIAADGATGPDAPSTTVNYNLVSPGYFDLLGITRLQGRAFDANDDRGRPDVAVVNEKLARDLWPDDDPLGKRMRVRQGDAERSVEVVGMVADIKYRRLSEPPTPFVYLPQQQWDRTDLVLHVRPAAGAAGMTAALSESLRAVDPELPLTVRTLRDEMAYSLAVPKIVALVVGVSGLIGLVLATGGVFAMVSYATARRVPEIGIRITLGAGARDVRRLVVLQGLRPTLWGVLFGLLAAGGSARLIAGLLYGVEPLDLLTLGGVSALLVGVAVLASYLPARRASRVDPVRALRSG